MFQDLVNLIFRPSQESATSEVKLIQTTKDKPFKLQTANLGTKEKKVYCTSILMDYCFYFVGGGVFWGFF